ncbi:DUF4190 domain-containing protein [Mycobacterium sp. M1]|uniref:DUF4190 domain-containing protein n=1 Tax=Mycolicibacter acidiphilus TaxID=2835306 RepID=A0ABS5RJE9_9MYCO|nr:DUF4190 domain-containing protein [Mycolicibacter acidiphilus]MBS9533708.1 DUF4190 domain-containing protein [Mycolicibacter acidiphilus]
MYPGSDPFGTPPHDPFGAPPPPASGYGPPISQVSFGAPAPQAAYNTFAVLSPIMAVVIPPAGVALGHIALPQIARTHERGRGAAIAGLALGYLMCLVLIGAGLWWGTHTSEPSTTSAVGNSSVPGASVTPLPPSVVTSIAAAPAVPRVKLDLATVPIGMCVEVQIRSTERAEALDLYQTQCVHQEGVYRVDSKVESSVQCSSEFVAAPPDRAFALCLNPF